MARKKLFKSFTAAAIAALTVTAGIAVTGAIGDGFNPAGLLAPTTAYAFEHQSYADSTGYSLRLDGDTWHCYNADGQVDYSYDGLALNQYCWWKVTNGTVDFSFKGIAENQYGSWMITNGIVDFDYTGRCQYGGKIYDVTRGYAVYVKDNDTSSKENSNAENNVTSNNNEILYKLM